LAVPLSVAVVLADRGRREVVTVGGARRGERLHTAPKPVPTAFDAIAQ
jgi:hypothetical protein